MSVQTPNMLLIQPTIGVDSGLTWEQAFNACMSIIDGHNHTAGYGVQIPPSGLNINSPLTFNNQQAINLQASVFFPQSSLSTLNALFVGTDGNLYFNDGLGDPSIQITAGGYVNASSSGISSGTATAAFSSSVLVVNAAANTPANIQGASILLGNNAVNSKFLTLSPPNSMAANYTVTLPASNTTGSLAIMTMDTSNNMAASTNVDNSTIVISGGILQVPTGGITATQIASGTITATQIASGGIIQSSLYSRTAGASVAAGNVAISTYSSQSSTTSTSPVAITGTATLVTTGRPVKVEIIGPPQSGGQQGFFACGGTNGGTLYLYVDGSLTSGFSSLCGGSSLANYAVPALSFMHVPTAASHVYQLYVQSNSGSPMSYGTVAVMAYEL